MAIDSVIICDMECPYDPETSIAQVLCNSCSATNEIEIDVVDGEAVFQGFVCEKCGAWNGPDCS